MENFKKLVEERDTIKASLKEANNKIKEFIIGTEMYMTILETTVSTSDDNGYDVSEKDAAKHAYNVTLKNYELM